MNIMPCFWIYFVSLHKLLQIMENRHINNQEEVEQFLRQFKPKMDIFGIIVLNRQKNQEALRLLGLTEMARKEVIKTIEVNDYVETIRDAVSYGDMWVFGKDYDGTELYIKISMGQPNSNTICVSFHTSEHPIDYAFK